MARIDWRKAGLSNPDPARVIDVGVGWLLDQPTNRKKSKKRKAKPKRVGDASVQVAPLIIPFRKVELISSIMRDLGRALPTKRNRLNNRLKKLIEDGVIADDGEIIRSHPIIQEWYSMLEKQDRL
jgi:hypothetical protein